MASKEGESGGETWADKLRAAVRLSSLTQYAICQAAGIERSMLTRFMQGAGISLETAEKIGRVLGFDLVPPRKRLRVE
jgi:transcriptional regulator with XRE-family HTH domain